MARLSNGFLGNASGKIGNIVFARWHNIFTARQYQPDIQDANSPAQQKQRTRMMALLQFLKPINKSFIRRFNAALDKNSTPWAVAIKANMKGVSPDACFPMQNLILGQPSINALGLIKADYDPFINQLVVQYSSGSAAPLPKTMPLVMASVLGKYKSLNELHLFDTRFLLDEQPLGFFFSPFLDNFVVNSFDGFWDSGMLWLLFFEPEKATASLYLNENLSFPAHFKPEPILEFFNTDYSDDVVPVKAITWQYSDMPGEDVLVFTVDLEQTSVTDPDDAVIGMVMVSLYDEKIEYLKPELWQLTETSLSVVIGNAKAMGSFMVVYGVVNKDMEQISRFNRFYVNENIDKTNLPLFQQLFDTAYTHPGSFILNANTCGFCGSIDELFSDFIAFWERLNHKDDPPPDPPVIMKLSLSLIGPGDVIVENCLYIDELYYYFNEGDLAQLTVEPDELSHFVEWTGPDAVDVQLQVTGIFSLTMSKDRDITANFELDEPEL